MEVIAIQKSVFDGMKNEFKELLELTENATRKYTSIFKEEKWLDNQEVCDVLRINKKTLQAYRAKGILPFSRIKNKLFYKPEDIQRLLDLSYHPLIKSRL